MLLPTNTMNANTIKAPAKPLGMLAVRCAAPCFSFEYTRRLVDGVRAYA